MKEHGILMSGPMVRAMLAGAKTETRRTSDQWAKAQPGDVLWVRETYCPRYGTRELSPPHGDQYRADWKDNDPYEVPPPKWRSGRFMPRSACRLEYELKAIHQELLHDITHSGALREGMPNVDMRDLVELARGSRIRAMNAFEPHLGGKTDGWERAQELWREMLPRDRYRVVFSLINTPEAWTRNEPVWVLRWA